MNKKWLYKEIGMIDDDLIESVAYIEKTQKNNLKKWIGLVACICIFISLSSTVYAVEYLKNQSTELYIRYLSPENMELTPEIEYDADKFFDALKSDKEEYVYIAINRLIECFNDEVLREKAIKKITPFIKSEQEKIAQAAMFAVDILSQRYQSENIYKLSDGSLIFMLFNNYSDYGSHNVLWRIKDNVLEQYIAFPEPFMYITDIIPSPDHSLLAVKMASNKSEFIVIIDIINGKISPELVGTARGVYGAQKGVNVPMRIDNENYCSINSVEWITNDRLLFNSMLTYNNAETAENVTVDYGFSNKSISIQINN